MWCEVFLQLSTCPPAHWVDSPAGLIISPEGISREKRGNVSRQGEKRKKKTSLEGKSLQTGGEKERKVTATLLVVPPVVTQCWDDQWVINVWPFVVTQGESLATAGYSVVPTKLIFLKQHWISFWKKEDQWVITVWTLHLLSESLAPAGSMGGCPTNIQYTSNNSFYKSQQYGFGFVFVPQLQLYEGYIVGNGGFYMALCFDPKASALLNC